MGKIKLLVTAPMHFLPSIQTRYKNLFDIDFIYPSQYSEIKKIIGKYHALIPDPGAKYRIDNDLLIEANKLQLIVTPSTGTDHIDLDYCNINKIIVKSLKGTGSVIDDIHASAEFSFLLLLSMIKKFVPSVDAAKAGKWREIEDRFRGIELSGKTVGLIGLGRIGKKMARYCNSFGARVIAVDPVGLQGVENVEIVNSQEELLRNSDIVCLHIHLTEDNYDYFGDKEFQQMKDGAFFLNTSRGGLLNEKSLIKALETKKITAAALDVIKGEQNSNLKDHQLIKYARLNDNLIISPHIAGLTVDSQGKAAEFAFKQVKSFF
jgi:D-3-phosphoglycerate dehydrogenase / 2-oxoglutarate reductase